MESPTVSIRAILEQILSGQVRIPAFQRGFVWDPEQVAYFMDSIYKGYPFGSLLFWRTKSLLKHDRKLGPYDLPSKDPDYPIDYVLDGQQRITSIFCVFQNTLPPQRTEDWLDIYFDHTVDEGDPRSSQFRALEPDAIDPTRHIPLNCFFDSAAYRKQTSALEEAVQVRVDAAQQKFKECLIPVQTLRTEDRAQVAIVFERVNRRGVALDTLQLLAAWTWSNDFDLLMKFRQLKERLEEFGFAEVGEDTDLLLSCCAAVLCSDPAPESLVGMSGADVRDGFERIENGIYGAIDFLQKQLGVETLKNLPYPSLLIPLSVFYAAPAGKEINVGAEPLATLKRWFWRACFSRRYSSQTSRTTRTDIEEMVKLKSGQPSQLGNFPADLQVSYFTENQFRLSTANTNTFILLLAQQTPLSFLSGAAVDLSKVLQAYNRAEYHHIYPNAYLRKKGIGDAQINCLANFAIISRAENNKIRSKAPSVYKADMPGDSKVLQEVLAHALCPATMFNDVYDPFVAERANLLLAAATKLMS